MKTTKKIKIKKQENVIIGIYKITSPKGRIYVGQSTNLNKRLKYYEAENCKRQPLLYRSILKYGWKKHKFEIIEFCSISKLDKREIYWGEKYDVLNPKKGLNCKELGKCGRHSEMTKIKIGESHKNIDKSYIALNNKGRKFSKKWRNNMSTSRLGKKKSKDCIIKMSTPINQYDLEGNFIKEWIGITEAKKHFKGDIAACCIGRQKTAGGYIWKHKLCID